MRDQHSAGSKEGHLASFLLLALASFFHNISLQCFFHLPQYLEEQGHGEFAIGSIMAILPAIAILVRPSLGARIDHGGTLGVLRLGGVLHVLACLSYLAVPAWEGGVVLARVIHGISMAALFSAMFTIAADLAPPARRTQFLGWFGSSGMVALMLSGVIGDAVLARGSYRALFWLTAAFALAGTLSAWRLPVADRSKATRSPGAFLKTLCQRNLLPVWLLGFGYALAITATVTFTKLWLTLREVGSLGGFFAAFGGAALVLRVGFGSLPDRVGNKRVLLPCVLSMGAGLWLLAVAQSNAQVLVAGGLCGVAHAYLFPIITNLVIDRAGPERRGRGVALFTALFDAGVLLGSPGLGYLVERASYPLMFRTAAGVMLACVVGFLILDRARKR